MTVTGCILHQYGSLFTVCSYWLYFSSLQVSFPADTSSAPTVSFPLDSGSEPRFEVKGLNFDSPLSLNSGQSDVYTSDKLNFL